jgi:hypothetical protein
LIAYLSLASCFFSSSDSDFTFSNSTTVYRKNKD